MAAPVVTCIDIGATAIRAAAVRRRKGVLELVAFGSVPTPEGAGGKPPEAAELARALRGVLRTFDLPCARVVTSLGGQATMTRYLGVPIVPPWKLEEVMAFEVEEQVVNAGGIDNIGYDYRILNVPGFDESLFPVMTALAQAPALEARFALLKAAGVRHPTADLGGLGAFNLFRYSPRCNDDEISVLLDIGGAETHFTLQRGNQLLFARTLPLGGAGFTERLRQALDLTPREAEEIKCREGRVPESGGAVPGKRERGGRTTAILVPPERLPAPSSGPGRFDEVLAFGDEEAEKRPTASDALPFGDGSADSPAAPVPEKGTAAAERARSRAEAIGQALRIEAMGLASQCQGMLRFFAQQFKIRETRPARIFLTGGGARLRGLDEFLARQLEAPTEVLDVSDIVVPVGRTAARWESLGGERGAWALAVGLAVGHAVDSPLVTRLIPPREKKRRIFWRRTAFNYYSVALAALSGALLLIAGCPGASGWWQAEGETRRAAQWGEAVAAAQTRNTTLRETQDANQLGYRNFLALAARVEAAGDSLAAVMALERVVPRDVILTAFELRSADLPEDRLAAPAPNLVPLTTSLTRSYLIRGYIVNTPDHDKANDRLTEFANALEADGVFARTVIMRSSAVNSPETDPGLIAIYANPRAADAPANRSHRSSNDRGVFNWNVSLSFELVGHLAPRRTPTPPPEGVR